MAIRVVHELGCPGKIVPSSPDPGVARFELAEPLQAGMQRATLRSSYVLHARGAGMSRIPVDSQHIHSGGRYLLLIGSQYINGYNDRSGNPAYLMNDLGASLNNVHANGNGAVVVGPTPLKSCTIQAGDEMCWDYGDEYWPSKRDV